ncbi:hypothetical protein C8Q75DRAFT_734122 [Abortiporus biennis]|nr:hypothetical protein C8Q75DRAFT_734122 [Abortiporus biennis]
MADQPSSPTLTCDGFESDASSTKFSFFSGTYNGAAKEPSDDATNAWSNISKIVRNYDDHKIKGCKEEIDTLLVFAGLYSAILTGFIVESYKFLQEDSGQVSAQLLKQIAQTLSTGSPPLSSSTFPPFQPTGDSILINSLWFFSLVLSLITASLGILVKQWLREYTSHDSLSPRAYIRVRTFRSKGLAQFRVFDIVALLPFLLQLSLFCFFLGLCKFLHVLNPAIGWFISGSIMAWMTALGTAVVLPLFSNHCPYKTPFFKDVVALTRRVSHKVWIYLRVLTMHTGVNKYTAEFPPSRFSRTCKRLLAFSYKLRVSLFFPSQSGLKEKYDSYFLNHPPLDEALIKLDSRHDIQCLVTADTIFMDDELLNTIAQCLGPLDLIDVVTLRKIVLDSSISYFKQVERDQSYLMMDEDSRSWDAVKYELYEALLFVSAPGITYLPELGELFSHMFQYDEKTACQALSCLCHTKRRVAFLQYLDLGPIPTRTVNNLLSASITLLEYYLEPDAAPPPGTLNFVDPDKRIYIAPYFLGSLVLSLLLHADNDVLAYTYSESLTSFQYLLTSAIEFAARHASEERLWLDGIATLPHPMKLLHDLEQKVGGVVNQRLLEGVKEFNTRLLAIGFSRTAMRTVSDSHYDSNIRCA